MFNNSRLEKSNKIMDYKKLKFNNKLKNKFNIYIKLYLI